MAMERIAGVKSETWIIVELAIGLMVLGLLSFFVKPQYEKGAWFVIGSFASAFSLAMGYKFGRSMPQQATDAKPGQVSQTTTRTIDAGPPEQIK